MLPGSGPLNPTGRPKGSGARPRLVDVARDLAEGAGIELEDALQAVVAKVLSRAKDGDMVAARLLLERLTVDEADPATLRVQFGDVERPDGPEPPTGRDLVDYLRGLAKCYRDGAELDRARAGGNPDSRLAEHANSAEDYAASVERDALVLECAVAAGNDEAEDRIGQHVLGLEYPRWRAWKAAQPAARKQPIYTT